jgi:uncharacterized protein YwgA
MRLDSQDLIDSLSDLDKIALLLLHANNDSPVRDELFYQKEFFLISDYMLDIKDEADFAPDSLGPYSEAAEVSLNNLRSYKLVDRVNEGFKLTEKGQKISEMVEREVSSKYKEAIFDFKKLLNDLTKDELLAFIYFSFPDFTNESIIRQGVIRKREPTIMSLYKKNKISLARAASLAGLCIEDFLDKMKA